MQAKFICHQEFSLRTPRPVFHKAGAGELLHDEPQYQNRHILYRRSFACTPFSRATLKVTADDYFKLYINGRFVTQGPPQGYPSRYYYMETDLTEFLTAGENTIAVHAYYQGLCNRALVSSDARQCLWAELYLDGELVLVTDEQWRVADHTGYTACGTVGYATAFNERYDSRAPEVGFERPQFNDASWAHAAAFKNADYTLVPSPLKALSVYRRPPKSCRAEEGRLTLDFGQEMAGGLLIEAFGKAGDEVTVRYGEELNGDTVRYDLRCNCVYEDTWVLSGGHDFFEPFEYKAFRYAEILFPAHAHIGVVRMRVQHYPCEAKAVYEESPALQKVLRLCENTVRYGVQESVLDCPTRERGQYLGDLCVSGRAHAALTQDTVLLKKALSDFAESSRICLGLMAVAPASFMQEIADYSLLFPALVRWVYAVDGDLAFVEGMLPCIEGILAYFARYAREDGLLEGVTEKWNVVDWPESARDGYDFALTEPVGRGVHNTLNAFWIGCLQAADALFACAKKPRIQSLERVQASFIRAFYNQEKGLFCDAENTTHTAYHSNVLPLLFGIGTQDEALKGRLVDFICKKGLRAGSVYIAYFALAALVQSGEREKAEALATAPDAWLGMLEAGATTTFEAWRKEDKWNTSLCHPWACAPLVVFCKTCPPY